MFGELFFSRLFLQQQVEAMKIAECFMREKLRAAELLRAASRAQAEYEFQTQRYQDRLIEASAPSRPSH